MPFSFLLGSAAHAWSAVGFARWPGFRVAHTCGISLSGLSSAAIISGVDDRSVGHAGRNSQNQMVVIATARRDSLCRVGWQPLFKSDHLGWYGIPVEIERRDGGRTRSPRHEKRRRVSSRLTSNGEMAAVRAV